jgi:hypothetical protein
LPCLSRKSLIYERFSLENVRKRFARGQEVQSRDDLGTKGAEFVAGKHRIWGRNTRNLCLKDLWLKFALPICCWDSLVLKYRRLCPEVNDLTEVMSSLSNVSEKRTTRPLPGQKGIRIFEE